MKSKRQFHKKETDAKVKVFNRVFIGLMLFLFGIVLYDSFIHALPFYYILFFFGGILIGRFVAITQQIEKKDSNKKLTIKVRPIGILLTVLLLIIRLFAGKLILDEFHVIWATDALYLIFIGVYYKRRRDMLKQIDERVYTYLYAKKNDKKVNKN